MWWQQGWGNSEDDSRAVERTQIAQCDVLNTTEGLRKVTGGNVTSFLEIRIGFHPNTSTIPAWRTRRYDCWHLSLSQTRSGSRWCYQLKFSISSFRKFTSKLLLLLVSLTLSFIASERELIAEWHSRVPSYLLFALPHVETFPPPRSRIPLLSSVTSWTRQGSVDTSTSIREHVVDYSAVTTRSFPRRARSMEQNVVVQASCRLQWFPSPCSDHPSWLWLHCQSPWRLQSLDRSRRLFQVLWRPRPGCTSAPKVKILAQNSPLPRENIVHIRSFHHGRPSTWSTTPLAFRTDRQARIGQHPHSAPKCLFCSSYSPPA